MGELIPNKYVERAKLINKKLTTCRSVKRLIKQKAWRDIVQPLLDEMIGDVIGKKRGNVYKNGHLCKPEGNYEYFTGYKQGLMDFNNQIWNYIDSIESLTEQLHSLEKKVTGEEKYINPMLGGKYGE